MIQRLQLEEAQQPSAYAISAARESGEYRDDRDDQSLALEFQALLAQISGQLAAIPDQAMAVGLALAQTAGPTQAKRERQSDVNEETSTEREVLFEQDTGAKQGSGPTTSRRFEVSDQAKEDDADETDTQVEVERVVEQQVLVDDTSEVVCAHDGLVEVTEEQVFDDVSDTLVLEDNGDEDAGQVIQGDVEEDTDQEASVAVDSSLHEEVGQLETSTKEQVKADVKQARVAVKQDTQDDSGDDDGLSAGIAGLAESAARDSEQSSKVKKNGPNDGKNKDNTDELHGVLKAENAHAGSDSFARNQSQKQASDRRQGLQEGDVGAQAQKLVDNSHKGSKLSKDQQAGEVVETLGTPVARSADRASDGNSFQMTILRQSFDALKMGRVDDKGVRPQTNSISATSASSEAKSAQNEQPSRKGLTRPQVTKMLERVEATLKEAARSRDGRTISLHLEPVNLGKVKVDVSLREGVLHARIAPENQQVMQALREHAHELHSSLRKLGLDAESISVSVTSDTFEGEMNTGQQMSDGRSFQDERNNMPRERAQLAENTVGNELAQLTEAGAELRGSATPNDLDHWVA